MKNFYYLVTISVIIFYSSLNAQWVQTNGPNSGTILCLAISSGLNTNLFAGTSGIDGGVFRSTNNGTSWTAINNGLPNNQNKKVASLAINTSGQIFVVIIAEGVFRSTDNGANWIDTGCPIGNGASTVFINDSGYIFIGTCSDCVGCPSGVFRSTNNGENWDPINTGLGNNVVSSFNASPNMAGGTNLYAGTYYGGVFLSTNNGTSWIQTGLTGSVVLSLTVSGTDLFAGTYDGLFRSTNHGLSWTQSGLFGDSVEALTASGSDLFAGTYSHGVFLSNNNGLSWTSVNTGLTDTFVAALAVSDTNLFAGTYEGNVWRRSLSDMITSVEQNYNSDSPNNFVLKQNYPNPFNPSTTINFSIPTSEFVSLKVYDVLGREVQTLVNEEKPTGSYEVNFKAGNIASGIYLYTLQAGKFTETKKLILLK